MQSDSLASPSAKSRSRAAAGALRLWRNPFHALARTGGGRQGCCLRGDPQGSSPGRCRDAPRGRCDRRRASGEFPSTAILLGSARGLPAPEPRARPGRGTVPSVRPARARPSPQRGGGTAPPPPLSSAGPRPGPCPPVLPHRRASPPRGRSVTGPPPRSRLPETQPGTAAGGSPRRHLPARVPPRRPPAPPGTPAGPGGGGSAPAPPPRGAPRPAAHRLRAPLAAPRPAEGRAGGGRGPPAAPHARRRQPPSLTYFPPGLPPDGAPLTYFPANGTLPRPRTGRARPPTAERLRARLAQWAAAEPATPAPPQRRQIPGRPRGTSQSGARLRALVPPPGRGRG
ncbi:basic proline-rich protein-like [Passer domesticus]|uniref:basic proline-rich protein-like n=1 Tax=Passer domesticus TaxID=48849 RepID=UPI0030FF1C55